MNAIHNVYWLLAGASALVLVGIASSLIARRFGAPLLLVFLIIGMLAGADGPGGIRFSDYGGAYRLGSLALAIILFDGGLRTRFASVRAVLAPTLLLVSILTIAGYFQLFAEPYVMTRGGPLQSTVSLLYLMYEEGFRWWNLGVASAVAFVLFAIIVVITRGLMMMTRAESKA